MEKAFTLIELLVVITIVAILGSLIFAGFNLNQDNQLNPILFPREANAQANQQLVKEMAEQNRLMREMLEKKK